MPCFGGGSAMVNTMVNAAILGVILLGVVFIAYGVDRYLTREDKEND